MERDNQPLHTIFGAGQVGFKLAHVLLDRGYRVRLVRRSPAGESRKNLTWMSGDVTDPSFAIQAAAGAETIYDCVNPPDYSRWHGVLEPLKRGVREAAARAGARLVMLDCLYMYGIPEQCPFDETTPMRPCSDKGELRKQMVEELFEAHRRGDVEVTTGRASDYFGPETPLSMVFHQRAIARLLKGRTVEVFGDPDMPHAYSYTPDVARALAVLGTRPEAIGQAFHLPATWTGTTRELLVRAAAVVKQQPNVTRMPNWMLTTIGLFNRELAAIRKMVYQWEHPYVLDDSRFRATFGFEDTPLDEALATTLGLSAQTSQSAVA